MTAARKRKTTRGRNAAGRRKSAGTGRKSSRYWSAEVNQRSDALDIARGTFASDSPCRIALSLKRSAERSKRRKAAPYQSAMSMLNFYINRGGRGLSKRRKDILERAKPELRKLFGRA
jgi:hypothetical protein